jgi:Trypsin-like peptidase domain
VIDVAIIRRFERPAIAVGSDLKVDWSQWPDGEIALPPPERVERAVAGVARLLVHGDPHLTWVGSCFLAGPGLVLAASFAVSMVTEGAGTNVSLKDDRLLSLQFADGRTKDVGRVLFLHPYFRVALLELADGDDLPDPLSVASTSPENLGGKDVAVISCAAKDARNDAADLERIFGDDPERSFYVQPGKVLQVGSFIDGEAPGLLHDCSCVGGSGGGPLVDLASGHVLGLHTSGREGAQNYAEPLWELARDPVVWRFDIGFRPTAKPAWLDSWDSPAVPQSPVPAAGQAPGTWTVNEMPPIDFANPTVKTLLRTLYSNISDVTTAMNLALDAGVSRGTVDETGTAEQVWRRILVKASTKAVLGTLIRSVHDDPEYAGIKPILAQVL